MLKTALWDEPSAFSPLCLRDGFSQQQRMCSQAVLPSWDAFFICRCLLTLFSPPPSRSWSGLTPFKILSISLFMCDYHIVKDPGFLLTCSWEGLSLQYHNSVISPIWWALWWQWWRCALGLRLRLGYCAEKNTSIKGEPFCTQLGGSKNES